MDKSTQVLFLICLGYNYSNFISCICAMLKKILLVLVILAPSALYLYIVNREDKTEAPAEQTVPASQPAESQTPDH
jgi:hypothetical protein